MSVDSSEREVSGAKLLDLSPDLVLVELVHGLAGPRVASVKDGRAEEREETLV